MLMIRSAAVVVLLAAVYQASGFVSTRRRQHQPSAIIRCGCLVSLQLLYSTVRVFEDLA